MNFLVNHTIPKAMTIQETISATREDPTIQAIKKALKHGQWQLPSDPSIDVSSVQIFKTIKDELSLCEDSDTILHCNNVVILRSLRQRTVDIAHEGHQGIIKTKRLLREKVWFPYINRLVDTVKSCLACLATFPEHVIEPL